MGIFYRYIPIPYPMETKGAEAEKVNWHIRNRKYKLKSSYSLSYSMDEKTNLYRVDKKFFIELPDGTMYVVVKVYSGLSEPADYYRKNVKHDVKFIVDSWNGR